uniref:Protein LLP homolog n=1 Tax=Monodon monoceros TaxID=40151 RepID=A0A8C6BCD2_MONMO
SIIKLVETSDKKSKSYKEKRDSTYREMNIKMIIDISSETIQVRKQWKKTQYVVKDEKSDIKMEIDIKRNKKSLLDQRGQYSIWMNQRPKGGEKKKLKAKRKKEKGESKAKAVKAVKGLAW